ncbi:MAG: hypothetical protein NTZ44_02220 [Candidatus Nomurabacteria bacterium]|nr:hypothetical protein [Candidatus Nomurabacteria bacterium]
MKISYNKLKSYIPSLPEVNNLTQQIIFHAFEVEEIEKQGDDYMLDIKVLPDRAFDAKTEEGMVKEISVITGEPCDKEKITEALNKLGDTEHTIVISTDEIQKKLGITIAEDAIEKIFERFWYPYTKEGNTFTVTLSSYRPDLIGTHDLIDEIIRIHGYENLLVEKPEIDFKIQANEVYAKIQYARNKLLYEVYNEVMTYSFCNKGEVSVLASASDKNFLRTNLSDGIKESVTLNTLNAPILGLDTVKIFEVGTVFFKDKEEIHVAYGDKKKITEVTLDEFCKEMPSDFNLEAGTLLLENNFQMWSLYPFITRDIALWADESVESSQVLEIIKENAGELLARPPRLFDTFKKEGKVSYGFRLVFQSKDKTLTDEEVSIPMAKITEKLVSNGFVIR